MIGKPGLAAAMLTTWRIPSTVIYGSRFERYMSNSSSLQTVDNLDSFLSGRNTGSNTEAFDGKTLLAHFLPQR
jgi:hypothetical protein